MGIHHSPHTHTIPIPMAIPTGITIPTAALRIRLERGDSTAGTDVVFVYTVKAAMQFDL